MHTALAMSLTSLVVLSLLLLGCQSLDPETISALGFAIDNSVASGQMTKEQGDAMKELLSSGFSWEMILGNVVTLAGAFLGVRLWRGGVENRRGTIPVSSVDMVQK